MPNNPESEDLFLAGQNMSAEARAVTREAVDAVKNWIDNRIKTLTEQARTDLAQAQKEFDEQWKEASAALDKSAETWKAFDAELANLELKLGDSLKERATLLRKTAQAARDDLEARKQTFRKGGELVGRSIVKAVAAL